ncbi:fractalkine-like [Scomber scombrus]|uniref:Fractalkine-like n=1 Tax=Scomber scombrus TaxID=13677 RepID=A0AAV1N0G4_SCOSC|nr:C-C motif chemokine 2-like [Scomber scombrus]
MGFGVVLATLLCIATWMTSVHTTHGPMRNCCVVTSTTKVPLIRIMSYTIQQEGVCPISAIVFRTILGKNICSDPKTVWAKRAMDKVDKEMKALLRKGQNEEGSTSDTMTPAVSMASTEAGKGQNEEGSTSDTMTPAVSMASTEAGKGQNKEGSTSGTVTPAVSSPSTKAPQTTGRNRMRQQRKRRRNGMRKGNRRGRKGQRKCQNP